MKKGIKAFLLINLFMGLVFAQPTLAAELTIVGTESTMTVSQNWLDFLHFNEIPFAVVNPAEFQNKKKAEKIVVIGSMDESNDIKKILKEALTPDEIKWISLDGNGDMYLKSDIWTPGQMVILFAGSDQVIAEQARMATRDDWFDLFVKWFRIEVQPTLRAY